MKASFGESELQARIEFHSESGGGRRSAWPVSPIRGVRPPRRANSVAPGPISGGAPEQKYENFGAATVLGRPGQPEELASIYVQFAADDASFATGNIYGSGGGQGQP
jgi:Enoyl-(Acyl carrier protein) reductase